MTAAGPRVLLFGASGFLGGQVAAALAAGPGVGDVVRAGRRAGTGGRWVRHDLVEEGTDRLATLLRDVAPDVVVSCAGRLAGTTAELVAANVLVTARLLDAMTTSVPGARLVVLGSAAEYGPVPELRPVDEDAAARPVSGYGVTRLASTQLVRLAVAAGRLDGVVLRVFNPIGPGVTAANVVGQAAAALEDAVRTGRDHVVLGPLGAWRDFVDVRDVASAVLAATVAGRVEEPVLNVGSGTAVQVRDVVARLARVAGFAGEIREAGPAPARSAGVGWIAADLGRIHRTLGWSPRHDLDASVAASWEARAGRGAA